MDIEEAKKFARNKIDSDAITKQVRNVIKEKEWQKQDMREGFIETFKPLIESQDNIKKSIDNQQNATINLQNATINQQNETINQLQNNQIGIRELIDQMIQNRRNDDVSRSDGIDDVSRCDGNDDGSDSDDSDIFYDLSEGDNNTSEIQNNQSGSDNDNDNDGDGEGDGEGEGDGSEYDINIRNRLNELLLIDSEFNKNLTSYKTIKILGEHNFFSFPSDFYEYDINEIEKRKTEVRNFLSNYYSKLQDYANFYNEYDIYSLAKLKDKFLRSENKDLVRLLQNEINNYNALSIYFTNLSYVEYYKNNERSGLN